MAGELIYAPDGSLVYNVAGGELVYSTPPPRDRVQVIFAGYVRNSGNYFYGDTFSDVLWNSSSLSYHRLVAPFHVVHVEEVGGIWECTIGNPWGTIIRGSVWSSATLDGSYAYNRTLNPDEKVDFEDAVTSVSVSGY